MVTSQSSLEEWPQTYNTLALVFSLGELVALMAVVLFDSTRYFDIHQLALQAFLACSAGCMLFSVLRLRSLVSPYTDSFPFQVWAMRTTHLSLLILTYLLFCSGGGGAYI